MASLKDQFQKANLISKKQAKQLDHAARVKKTQLGEEGLAEEQSKLEAQRKAEQARERDKAQKRDEERKKKQQESEGRHRMADLVKNGALSQTRGPKRFFFVTRDNKVPFLDVTEDLARKLEAGHCAIVEAAQGMADEFALVPREVADRLMSIDRKAVLFLNGAGGH